ncbi:uncharacterized protein LOC115776268 [Archocentrus centrarchus]|uniref:uncharacterized protein LOC115776268 n=1 Tax=Archocentrus centrarchus TaxID=63155 RepID=UPI0011EA4BDB|nr:uncharacterized protein LOC115776268 [Archocentrus centrarchus]
MNNRFFMNDDKTARNISITVRAVRANDSGTYWCGAGRTDHQPNNTILNRLLLTVRNPVSPSPAAPESFVSSQVVLVVIVCVALLLLMLLMFVIVLILIYKRFSRLKSAGNGASAQHIKEDNIYEEVQEHRQYPNTVYVTLSPPNQPAALHYSTISFQSRPDTAGGETLTVKPSSSACRYSAVKFSKCPTNSSVSHLHRGAVLLNRPQEKLE